MGDQQGKTENLDLAWLAGFIDGEGSFMVLFVAGTRMQQYRREGKAYINPRICVANTDEPTLEIVRGILSDNGLPHHIYHRKGGVNKAAHPMRDSWSITAQGMKRCKRWLEVILPYLRTKRDQAEAMLKLINLRLDGKENQFFGQEYTAEEWELVEYLRGRSPNSHRLNARLA